MNDDKSEVDHFRMVALKTDFAPPVKAMLERMLSKIPKYGFSYRDCEMSLLLARLKNKVVEFEQKPGLTEAIDVANMALMLVYRKLRETEKK